MKMEEKKIDNGNMAENPDKKKEIHYHYHMDEKPGPSGPVTTEKKPGEMHYHYYYEPPRMQKPRSSKPTIAGVLLLIQAIMSVIAVVFLIGAGMFMGSPGDGFMFFGAEDTGDITGEVTSFNDGLPIENATITVLGTDLSAMTNEKGEYLIYNVPVGNQRIQVEKEGFNTIILKTFVEPENMDMDMDPNEPDRPKNHEEFILTDGNDVIEKGSYPPWELIRNLVLVCGVILVILTILVILGAYASFKRENFRLAIVGAVAGIITLGLFSFIALFILLLAKDEFKKPQKDTPSQGPLGGE
jgi:hypothetical protein